MRRSAARLRFVAAALLGLVAAWGHLHASAHASAAGTVEPEPGLVHELQRIQDEYEAMQPLTSVALAREASVLQRRDALTQLGRIFFYGNASMTYGSTVVNATRAMVLFAHASAMGEADAQFHVGVAHSYGFWGFAQDDALAMTHYYFASLAQHMGAVLALGHRHALGIGAPKSCESGVRYYEAAADRAMALREANTNAYYDGQAGHAEESDATPASEEDHEAIKSTTPAQPQPQPVIYDLPHRRLKTVHEAQHKKNTPSDDAIVDYYQFSADKGDPEATINLATLYYYGARGLPQDVTRAASLFQRAYDLGASGSAYNLGHIYNRGIGVTPSNETAVQFFEEAAKEGSTAAQNELAFMYLHGRGVARSHKQALALFKAAAKQGSADAFYNLGVLHMQGAGSVPKQDASKEDHGDGGGLARGDPEYEVAHGYFQVAAHQGHTLSSHKLGHMSLHGIGTPRSCKQALDAFKVVAERGEWDRLLSKAFTEFKQREYEAAFQKYAVMAQQGYEVAQHNAAYLLDYGFLSSLLSTATSSMLAVSLAPTPTPSSLDAVPGSSLAFASSSSSLSSEEMASGAIRLYKLSAMQGNVDANLKIGDFYYYGRGDHPVDYSRASAHYSLASKRANAQAMFNLGLMYEHGVGVAQDFFLAKRYFDRALDSHSDARVPVTLALWKLRLHVSWTAWWHWWDELVGNVPVTARPSPRVTQAEAEAMAQTNASGLAEMVVQMLTEWLAVGGEGEGGETTTAAAAAGGGGGGAAVEPLSSWLGDWQSVVQGEDLLIVALSLALAVVLYVRSERQHRRELAQQDAINAQPAE